MDLSHLITDPINAVDPNVLLASLREAAALTMADLDNPETVDDVTANEATMAEAFLQLDDWIARGGFLPTPWQGDTE